MEREAILATGINILRWRAILDRKVPKQIVYLLLLFGFIYSVADSQNLMLGANLIRSLVLVSVFLGSLYSLPDGYHWLPGFSRRSRDEVGIEPGNLHKARLQNLFWILLLTALFFYLGSRIEISHA